MTYTHAFISFLLYGFLGFLIDTTSRSLSAGEFTVVTFLPIPFTPIYGMGALIVLLIAPRLKRIHVLWQWFVYSVVLGLFEYISGLLIIASTGKVLWWYEKDFFGIGGFTDVFHALSWGFAAIVLTHLIHPLVEKQIKKKIPHFSAERAVR